MAQPTGLRCDATTKRFYAHRTSFSFPDRMPVSSLLIISSCFSASMRRFCGLVALISRLDHLAPTARTARHVFSSHVLAQVAVPPPTAAQRAAILSAVAGEMQLAENLDICALAAATEGWSGAEVAAILRDAATAAIRENPDAQCIQARHIRIYQSADFTPT